jgi:hypothetical protein
VRFERRERTVQIGQLDFQLCNTVKVELARSVTA